MIAPYLDELTRRLRARLGDRLVAAWVVGSGALGDFDPERSDVDVQAVSAERLTRPLAGAHPRDVIPALSRGLVLTSLREALAWWRSHDDAQAAVAAGCRALAWVEDGRWLSKREAVEAFLDRVDGLLSPRSGA